MTRTAISFAAAVASRVARTPMAPCVCISVFLQTHASSAGCGKNGWNNNSSATGAISVLPLPLHRQVSRKYRSPIAPRYPVARVVVSSRLKPQTLVDPDLPTKSSSSPFQAPPIGPPSPHAPPHPYSVPYYHTTFSPPCPVCALNLTWILSTITRPLLAFASILLLIPLPPPNILLKRAHPHLYHHSAILLPAIPEASISKGRS